MDEGWTREEGAFEGTQPRERSERREHGHPGCGAGGRSRYREPRLNSYPDGARGRALTSDFVRIMLLLLGVAVAVYLIIVGLVFAANRRQTKRYRPGRPFDFESVWFVSQPEQQAKAGLTSVRELTRSIGAPTRRPGQPGGASDTW